MLALRSQEEAEDTSGQLLYPTFNARISGRSMYMCEARKQVSHELTSQIVSPLTFLPMLYLLHGTLIAVYQTTCPTLPPSLLPHQQTPFPLLPIFSIPPSS